MGVRVLDRTRAADLREAGCCTERHTEVRHNCDDGNGYRGGNLMPAWLDRSGEAGSGNSVVSDLRVSPRRGRSAAQRAIHRITAGCLLGSAPQASRRVDGKPRIYAADQQRSESREDHGKFHGRGSAGALAESPCSSITHGQPNLIQLTASMDDMPRAPMIEIPNNGAYG